MSEESLGVLILGTLIGSPIMIGVGCGVLAAETASSASTKSSEETNSESASVVAPAAATGGISASAILGAVGAGSLLLSSGIIGGIALGAGATAYAASEAYASEKGFVETSANILTPTNYLYKPEGKETEQSLSELYKTFKGYIKAGLGFITLPALLIGTLLGLTAKFISNLFPEETNKLKQDMQTTIDDTVAAVVPN